MYQGRILVLLLVLLNSLYLFAQDAGYRSGGFALRMYMVNYAFPNTSMLNRSDFAVGYEFEYLHPLGRLLDITFPVRMGEALYPGRQGGVYETGVLLSGDVQVHLRYYPSTAGFNVYLLSGGGLHVRNLQRGEWVIPVGGGMDLRLFKTVHLSGQLEYRFPVGSAERHILVAGGVKVVPEFRGLSHTRGVKRPSAFTDRDLDGIADEVDDCPDTFGESKFSGCPDSDSDGLPDVVDDCPLVPGPARGCPDADGDGLADKEDRCPLEVGLKERGGCPVRDRDSDGIIDDIDDCPDEVGLPTTAGCPDTDGDGVPDKRDDCPELPGFQHTAGCPDTDGDGVADKSDTCPHTAGPGSPDGCPTVLDADLMVLDSAARLVQFKSGGAELSPAAYPVLDRVVEVMRRYPDFELRIQVHTDGVGTAEANLKLSVNRGKACYEYLISRGIGPRRLEYEGFGESQPLDDNNTPVGRAQNRRVVFLLKPRN